MPSESGKYSRKHEATRRALDRGDDFDCNLASSPSTYSTRPCLTPSPFPHTPAHKNSPIYDKTFSLNVPRNCAQLTP